MNAVQWHEESERIRLLRLGEGRSGPPVLLVHGFTGGARAWGERILRELGRKRSILAVDLPGHGRSESPLDPERYVMSRVVSDLMAVLDREGAQTADWVGYSMGGRIALAAAVLFPGRVRRLVLESASPGLASEADRARRRAADEQIARRADEEGIAAFVDYWMSRPLFASQRALPPAVLERVRRLKMENDPAALAAVLRGLGTGCQPSFWSRLQELRMPVLLLTGERDPKFGSLARAMMPHLHRASHATVQGAGHAVHLEFPDAWLGRVVPFLEELPSPP